MQRKAVTEGIEADLIVYYELIPLSRDVSKLLSQIQISHKIIQ